MPNKQTLPGAPIQEIPHHDNPALNAVGANDQANGKNGFDVAAELPELKAEAEEKISTGFHAVERYVRDRPMESVAIAFLAGLALCRSKRR